MKLHRKRAGDAPGRWLPLVLFVLALAVYLPTVSKERVVTDNQASAASAWRIASTGRPWMEDVKVAELQGTDQPEIWLVDTIHGHVVHNRTGGSIVAAVPFYWVLNNDTDPRDFEVSVGGIAASFFTAGAGVFLFLALRSKFGDRLGFASAVVVLFATPVWSVSANALWTHTVTLIAISGAIWAATSSRWWLAGLFFAFGIFARPHLAVVAAVVGLYLGWRRKDWRVVASTGLPSSVGLLSLLIWNRLVFGSWSISGGYSDYVTDNLVQGTGGVAYDIANTVGFFFSLDRGLFIWTPVILLLVPSMLASWRHLPDWVRAFVLAGLLYSFVQLRINTFTGGQNFYGYRLALEMLLCMTPALVFAYRATAPLTKVVLGGLIGLQFAAIAIGAATEDYFVNGPDIWGHNAYLIALSDQPLLFALFTVACVLVGSGLATASLRRTRGAVGSAAGVTDVTRGNSYRS